MLKIEQIDSYYGESRVIQGLNLQAEQGKITCLIGRNGVGKSTTLKSIMGLVKTPTGKILRRKRLLYALSTRQKSRHYA